VAAALAALARYLEGNEGLQLPACLAELPALAAKDYPAGAPREQQPGAPAAEAPAGAVLQLPELNLSGLSLGRDKAATAAATTVAAAGGTAHADFLHDPARRAEQQDR
jgi:hypothetical protein